MKLNRLIIVLLLLATIVVGFVFLPMREWFTEFESQVKSLGTLGPLAMVLIYVLCTVLLIPASIVTVAAGTLFGMKTGFLVVIAGANLGALCSFLLARSVLRQKVVQWASANPKFRSLDQAIGKQGFKMVLLSRLTPVFPFVVLNYFLGLTAVRTGAYILANLLGMLPAMFLLVYIGAAARDAVAGQVDGSVDFYRQLLKYIGLAATVAMLVMVTRIARKALREAEQEAQDDSGHAPV